MTLTSTRLAGRYVLDGRIGMGGYCEVWRATDTVLTRPVAVKLLHPGYAQQGEALDRFKAEARHAGSLTHPNIARVYDYGEPVDGQSYLVMELVEGPSLAHVLTGGPLSARRTMDIVAQIASGLQAAHSAGLIHRDIKPANILFTPGGTVRITDFGIAHAIGSAPVTATGMVMGTPGYIAPERVSGAQAGPPSDLYALGVVAYECLAGSPPFAGGALDVAIAHRDRPLPPLPPSVPADVVAFVMTLVAKDPAWRPGSAGEVAYQAARLRDHLPPDADHTRPTFSPAPEVPRASGVQEVAAAVGAPGALAALGAVGGSAGAPFTVADDPASQAPAIGPDRPRRRRRRALTAAALALAALTCLVLVSVTGFTSSPHQAGPPSPTRSPAASAVTGSRAATTSPSVATSPASQPASQPSSSSSNASSDSPSPSQESASASASASAAQHGHKKGHGHGNGKGNGNNQ